MHCTLQQIDNDSPEVSEAGKDSISTIHQQQNKFTSLEDFEVSSLSRINSDSGSFIALPVWHLNHSKLTSSLNMDSPQLVFLSPLNKLKNDQHKGPRLTLPAYAYSAKSYMGRIIDGSNVRRRCQNKIANKASKKHEISGNSCSQSSLVCNSGLLPNGSSAVNSSDILTRNSKSDKSVKKNSRKRARKKGKQSKKQSSGSGSTEREVLTEEYVCVSLTSDTSSSNDVDKEVGMMSYTAGPEFSSSDDILIKSDCERNEMNGRINLTEVPKSCDSCIDEVHMSKATMPIIQKSAGESALFNSENQRQSRSPDFAVIDRDTKDIQHIGICCYNDTQDCLVLDSVSVGSNSDESTKAGDNGTQTNKASCGTTLNSGDGYFLGQALLNGIYNNCEHNGQDCIGNDMRVNQKRTVSKSSSFNKFGGVGISNGRSGKENNHSVWQKVQKNGSDECGGDLKKINSTFQQFDSAVKRDPSIVRKHNTVNVNVLSSTEDKKHLKEKVVRKLKGKMDSISKKGNCSCARKGSHFNMSMLNHNAKASVQQNDMIDISSQEKDQGLSSVSECLSNVNRPMSGFQTNRGEQITSEIAHNAQVHLEEPDPQKNDCHSISTMKIENIDIQDGSLEVPCENINQSDISEGQSPVSCNLSGNEVGQTEKEVSSADYKAQNHSSGSTLWKWMPIGKKDSGLAISESKNSSLECSDAPSSRNFDLESSVEPKVVSFSSDQISSSNANKTFVDQIYSKFSCLDEVENEKRGNQVACTLTECRNKHEVANYMICECEKQDTLEKGFYRIAQAVYNTCRAQRACEAVHMATSGPIAEFERLLHYCSPVICRSHNSFSSLTNSHDHAGGVLLCRHEIPDISLGCLWHWYDKHGSYGLEIRAEDYDYTGRLVDGDHFPFRAYFVPSLSAVQLFKSHGGQCVDISNNFPNCKVSEACETVDVSEHSSSRLPIFSLLFPQPHNWDTGIQAPTKTAAISSFAKDKAVTPSNSTCSGDSELIFEYFEFEQPQQRRPLYEKIQELVRGDIPVQSKTYGDPTKLESVNLQDLHPSSWYAVAWYPIYRIPGGNFRAAFLTYHSLGHLVRRSTKSNLQTVDSCIVSPVVGLQSYNAQGECWFQLKHSAQAAEMLGLNPLEILKERLQTLEETASVMARAVVNKGSLTCTNRHPDYEFFLSRRRY